MKRIIVLFLCLGLIGCATSRLDGYRNKNVSVSKTFPYEREIVYEKALEVSGSYFKDLVAFHLKNKCGTGLETVALEPEKFHGAI